MGAWQQQLIDAIRRQLRAPKCCGAVQGQHASAAAWAQLTVSALARAGGGVTGCMLAAAVVAVAAGAAVANAACGNTRWWAQSSAPVGACKRNKRVLSSLRSTCSVPAGAPSLGGTECSARCGSSSPEGQQYPASVQEPLEHWASQVHAISLARPRGRHSWAVEHQV